MARTTIEINRQDLQGRARFNTFVEQSVKGNFSQLYEWGEIKARTGWLPLRLLISKDGVDVGAISILKKTIPYTKKCIFYAPRGPVVDPADTETLKALFKAVDDLARKHAAVLCKIDPDVPVENTAYRALLEEEGFVCQSKGEDFEDAQPRYVFRLDIRPDVETLMANLHKKTRYNIRYAGRKGVSVRQMTDKKELKDFYKILEVTAKRDNFLIRSYEYFAWIYDEMVDKDLARFYLAFYEGQIVAATLATYCGDKCWYLYGASSNTHRKVMPNYLLQWTMIEEAKERGCVLYDFRGVSKDTSPDNPLYGLYRFKKGFNGDFTEYVGEFDRIYKPGWARFWYLAEPLYQAFMRFKARS